LHALVLTWFPSARINETASAYLFPGYLPLALAAAAVLMLGRGNGDPAPRAVLWPRLAVALELVVVASATVAIYATLIGPIRLRLGDVLRLSTREPWRAWLVVAVAGMARIALGRRVPFDLAARRQRARDAFKRWSARSRRQHATIFYVLLALLSAVLSLGTSGGLWPMVYWLPGMNFIRIPSRFMLLGILALAILAGIGFDCLTGRLARRKLLAAAIIAGALLIAEFAAMPLETIVYPIEIPAIDRWLDSQAKPFAIAEVPLDNPRNVGAYERRQTMYMLHSTAHWQKTVHGYSGLRPPLHFELYPKLEQFPDDVSIAALRDLGVRYVVVHTDYYTPADWAAVEQRLLRYDGAVKLEHIEGAGRVYSLVQN
jgi:hypothetical protein